MTEVLPQARPASPGPSFPEELEHNLHRLVQHNRATPPYDEQSALQPAAGMVDAMQDLYAAQYGQQYADAGLGIDFDGMSGLGPGPVYYDPNYSHSSSPYVQASPPTPHSAASDAGVRTRSGRRVGNNHTSRSRTSSRTRRSKSPTPKKKTKATKSDKLKTPKLTEPISVLTKDMDVPVKDMAAWVNRPVDVRLKEVEDRKGYVTRPMNSFMLYRSAYAERLKQWGVHNNHQVVSSMAGESWPLEPPEVREHYNDLAKLERLNHQNAHPSYKFSPSKAISSKKRKGGDFESDEDGDLTDFDDPDAEWGGGRRQRTKRQKHFEDPHMHMHSPYAHPHTLASNRTMWEANDDGKPLPQAIGGPYMDYRYYQHAVYPPYAMPTMENIRMRQMEHQGMPYPAPMHQHQSLVGLPGGQHHDLLQAMPSTVTPPPSREMQQFDPSLLSYGDGFMDGMVGAYENSAEQYNVPSDFLGTGQGGWEVDPSLQMLDTGGEFDKWMDESHQ